MLESFKAPTAFKPFRIKVFFNTSRRQTALAKRENEKRLAYEHDEPIFAQKIELTASSGRRWDQLPSNSLHFAQKTPPRKQY